MTTYKCPQYLLKAGFEIGKYGGGCRIEKHRRQKPIETQQGAAQVSVEYPTGPQDASEILRVTKQ